MIDFEKVLAEFNGKEGANAESIKAAGDALNVRLPSDYVAFLSKFDGGEGMIGEAYVMFWGTGDLPEMNAAYQVAEYAPGLLLIGSDGGGEALAFDMRKTSWPVVRVPFVGMDLSCVEPLAPSFNVFLKGLAG
jgi:hypothetical protein